MEILYQTRSKRPMVSAWGPGFIFRLARLALARTRCDLLLSCGKQSPWFPTWGPQASFRLPPQGPGWPRRREMDLFPNYTEAPTGLDMMSCKPLSAGPAGPGSESGHLIPCCKHGFRRGFLGSPFGCRRPTSGPGAQKSMAHRSMVSTWGSWNSLLVASPYSEKLRSYTEL